VVDRLTREQRSQNMAAVRNKNTVPEILARKAAHRLGLRFRLHRRDLPGSPDIVLPKHQAVIFVHGCFWHGHGCSRSKLPRTNARFWSEKIEKNKLRDVKAERDLRKGGWKVFTVWQCELRNLEAALRRLAVVARKLDKSARRRIGQSVPGKDRKDFHWISWSAYRLRRSTVRTSPVAMAT
jgi:DNA mismatch endonuclease, patch repair protein